MTIPAPGVRAGGCRRRSARGPGRLARAVFLAAVACVVPVLAAATASAQGAETIGGVLRDPEGAGLEGVELRVTQDGRPVSTAVTGPDGSWVAPVPGPGTYEVELDRRSLPKGVALRDPDRRRLDSVEVRPGQAKVVLFPLAGDEGAGAGAFTRLLNLGVDGLKLGLVVAVAAVGLSLIFGVMGLVNFAHGELVTFGAVAAFLLSSSSGLGVPLLVAGAAAAVLGAGFGLALERGLWLPLRRRRTGTVAMLVVSIGLSLLLRHLILLVFEGAPRSYTQFAIQRPWEVGPVSVLPKELVVMAVSVAALAAVGLLLSRTRLGTAVRAVSDDADLARASGIDVDRVVLTTWVATAALAALGGVLYGVLQTVVWDMGFTLLLTMFAAVILGGLGSVYGAMVGGVLVGLASEVSTFWVPVEFKSVVALSVLIVVLLARPQGILGVRERIG